MTDAPGRRLRFVKMQGAGNDYLYVDGIGAAFDPLDGPTLARRLSDRHFGVGSDGLIALLPSAIAACRMAMWNADGSRGAMCGNGLRCLAKLARDLGHVAEDGFTVETDAGVRQVELRRDAAGRVVGAEVDMGTAVVAPAPRTAQVAGHRVAYWPVDVGNPHAVVFGDLDPERVDVHGIGAALQGLPEFPEGVNVEFVAADPAGVLVQRTFERGSGETLACGSGAVAAAAAAAASGRLPAFPIRVRMRGGEVVVRRRGSSLVLDGPAATVFTGEVEVAP